MVIPRVSEISASEVDGKMDSRGSDLEDDKRKHLKHETLAMIVSGSQLLQEEYFQED